MRIIGIMAMTASVMSIVVREAAASATSGRGMDECMQLDEQVKRASSGTLLDAKHVRSDLSGTPQSGDAVEEFPYRFFILSGERIKFANYLREAMQVVDSAVDRFHDWSVVGPECSVWLSHNQLMNINMNIDHLALTVPDQHIQRIRILPWNEDEPKHLDRKEHFTFCLRRLQSLQEKLRTFQRLSFKLQTNVIHSM